MSTKFKIDDIVRVLRRGSAGKHMQGAEGRVVKVTDGWVYVEDRTGGGLFTYGGTKSWMFAEENVELVEEALDDWEKELLGIETKQEETPVKQTFKAGDKVRVINGSRWHKQGESGKITAVDRWDNLELNGWWLSPQNVELVEPKAVKARSQEIELEDVQGGDLIVCFWQVDGVETRKKGIAHENDGDDDWFTEEGAYLTYDDELGDVGHIYLLERPEVKEPEIADGTYWVTEKDVNDRIWWKVEVKDSKATWGIRGDMSDVACADYGTLVRSLKGNGHVVHTSNPFPEPTDLERFEQAGYVGNIYIRPNNTPYKVTEEGKVMAWYKDDNKWSNISWDFETFHRSMVSGAFTKIS